jgi:predicted enzyme related to lactoylglutathione lyase
MSQADLRGKFIWHELMTPNAQTAADFYSSVLPWTTEASTVPGYTLWMNGAVGVAGFMTQPQAALETGAPPNWLVYIAAPDLDAIVATAQRLGGKLLKAPTDIAGIGRFAVLSDPQGAAFAVFTPAMAAPSGVTAAADGSFSWHELATIDPPGALAFYTELFGWTRGPAHDMGAGGLYQIIEHAGRQIGGVHVLQDPSKPPHWLSYVRVAHLSETLAAVSAHGGRVLRGPHVVPGGDRVAHIIDPQGGVIALHEPLQTGPAAKPRAAARKPAKRRPTTRRTPVRRKPAKRVVKRTAKKRATPRPARPAAKRAARPAARTVRASKTAAQRRAPAKRRTPKSPRRKQAAARAAPRRSRRR